MNRNLFSHVFTTAFALAAGLSISGGASAGPLLVAAGGGGGAGNGYCPASHPECIDRGGGPGQAGTSGQAGAGFTAGAGGVNGTGGTGGSDSDEGGGGAGWLSDGGDGAGGLAARSGLGGLSLPTFAGGAGYMADGGFGGGGGGGNEAGGGGGGYSGGGGGGEAFDGGGGGGSFIHPAFTNTLLVPGTNGVPNTGGLPGLDGYVQIDSTHFSYTGDGVTTTVHHTGIHFIAAAGAQGGSGESPKTDGGYGALLSGNVFLRAGTRLHIVVGGAGMTGNTPTNNGGAGGGGSFVYLVCIPRIRSGTADNPLEDHPSVRFCPRGED